MFLSKHVLGLFLLVVSLCGTLASYAQDIPADKAKIAALLEQIAVVFANGDIDGAMEAFTEDAVSRHVHILKRQGDGSWKTWRMMTNTPQAPAP